jgi:hypothetical protein
LVVTTTATHVLEEFRRLAPAEKHEVFQAIAQETSRKVRNEDLVKTVLESKGRIQLDPVLANEIALAHDLTPEEF